MTNQDSHTPEQLKQQYEQIPYPNIEIEHSVKKAYEKLYIDNLVTSYYLRNQQVIDPKDKLILDVGCGSGYTTLILAEANPDARIVAFDFSQKSLEVAQKRLNYHGFQNAEFHLISLDDVNTLGLQFDYIQCSDILYLLDDLVGGLKTLKSVLKPTGILRGNLHSKYQRRNHYLAQKACKLMGLMDDTPSELDIEFIREFMNALKDNTMTKRVTWNADLQQNDLSVLMNYLIVNDQGYTIPEMFEALNQADLEFISMTNWREWELKTLFKQPDNLPDGVEYCLNEASQQEKLALYELLNPIHRLLDFWCGHPDTGINFTPVSEWENTDWENAKIYLHPQLKDEPWQNQIISEIQQYHPIVICPYLNMGGGTLTLESNIVSVLLPLWDAPQTLAFLVKRWLILNPIDPISLEPISVEDATNKVKSIVTILEDWGYILLQHH